MTWVADSAINAEATADQPIKGSTLRKVQQNITAAFAGDSGAPPLAAAVVGAAYGLLSLDSVGMHRTISQAGSPVSVSRTTSPTFAANPFTPGTDYSAASIGLVSGTWKHVGGGLSGTVVITDSVDSSVWIHTPRYTNTFLRIA